MKKAIQESGGRNDIALSAEAQENATTQVGKEKAKKEKLEEDFRQKKKLEDMKKNAVGRNDIELSAEAQERRKQLKDERSCICSKNETRSGAGGVPGDLKKNAVGQMTSS